MKSGFTAVAALTPHLRFLPDQAHMQPIRYVFHHLHPDQVDDGKEMDTRRWIISISAMALCMSF